MEIRPAEVRDIPGMIGLLHQVGEVHRVIRPDIFRAEACKYSPPDLEEILKDPSRPIFVAAEEDRVLGYCFCIHKEARNHPVMNDRKELYIDDLCVEETCRGTGIATGLYAHVQAWAAEKGYDVITLNVWCGNDSALGFYEKMGMTPRNITMEMKLC